MIAVENSPKIVLPRLLRRFLIGSILLTVIAVATKFLCKHVLHLPENYDFFVFPAQYRFVDLTCFILRFKNFHHPSFFSNEGGLTFMYPAPSALLYRFFYILPWHKSLYLYVLTTGSCLLGVAAASVRTLERYGLSRKAAALFVTVCFACSYPLMVNYFLANIEIIVGLIVGTGLYFFITDRPWYAAACFGVAGALKLFPLIFLALLFQKKQYRQIAFALVLMGAITVFSLWLVSGSVAVSQAGIKAGLEHFRVAYALPFNSLDTGIDHSLFGLVKGGIVALQRPYPGYEAMSAFMRFYLMGTAVAGLLLYFLRIRFLPLLNQILILCTIAVLFTPASHDYTLMHLYVPFGMLVLLTLQAAREGRQVHGLAAAFTCFMFLLAPTNEFVLHGNVVGGQLKAILLAALLIVALRYPFATAKNASPLATA